MTLNGGLGARRQEIRQAGGRTAQGAGHEVHGVTTLNDHNDTTALRIP